ncbi:unnamed protein product [Durusdinium trenchii]|uniref:SET domain-containing protein n=1 Tax=Durusdinium trenchii TaxID=1381693 RepID=A0ABP0MSW7_9DINO
MVCYADLALGHRLLKELPCDDDAVAALREDPPRALKRFWEALRPLQDQIRKELGSLVTAALAESKASDLRGCSHPSGGIEIDEVPDRGRCLKVTKPLTRGSVLIREFPVAKVLLESKEHSLHPETRLALVLSAKEEKTKVAQKLLDHGGRDASALRMRGVLACCCGLCIGNSIEKVVSLFGWLGRVRINAVAVTALVEADGDMVEDKVALALYPELARCVNHSCRPNGLLRFNAKESHLVELLISSPHKVAAGEEVTISYGPLASSMVRSERQAALRAQYGFECRCPSCASKVQDEDFHWKRKAQMLDDRARAAVQREAWQEAAIACSASVAMLREGFRDGDIELAREECKLAGLTLRAGDAVKAREIWAAACQVLRPLVLPADPDLQEAEEMLKRLPWPSIRQERPPSKDRSQATFATAASKIEVAAAMGGSMPDYRD